MSYLDEVTAMRQLASDLQEEATYLHSPDQRRISTGTYARMMRAALYVEAAATMLAGQGQLAFLAEQQPESNDYLASKEA